MKNIGGRPWFAADKYTKEKAAKGGLNYGGHGGTRTRDLQSRSLAFYQLNYTPTVFNYYIILFLKRKG